MIPKALALQLVIEKPEYGFLLLVFAFYDLNPERAAKEAPGYQ
jgi:hypothetical protein